MMECNNKDKKCGLYSCEIFNNCVKAVSLKSELAQVREFLSIYFRERIAIHSGTGCGGGCKICEVIKLLPDSGASSGEGYTEDGSAHYGNDNERIPHNNHKIAGGNNNG